MNSVGANEQQMQEELSINSLANFEKRMRSQVNVEDDLAKKAEEYKQD